MVRRPAIHPKQHLHLDRERRHTRARLVLQAEQQPTLCTHLDHGAQLRRDDRVDHVLFVVLSQE
jgi:hypothetical protein